MRPKQTILVGIVIGLFAGLIAGVYFWFAGTPLVDEAIAIEEAAAVSEHQQEPGEAAEEHMNGAAGGEGPTVSRSLQRGPGMFAALGLTGAAFGCLFGVAYWVVGRTGTTWNHAILIGASLFVSINLVPWLKYPPNPPAVGDPDTIDSRTTWHLVLIAIAGLSVVAAFATRRALVERALRQPVVDIASAAAFLAPIGLALGLLPTNDHPILVPATLIWSFRLVSFGGNALIWAIVTAGFGLLAAHRLGELSTESPPTGFRMNAPEQDRTVSAG